MRDDEIGEKLSQIREIRNAGLDVLHVIHRHGIPSDSIAEVEAALIDAYSGLTNQQGGEDSAERGPMHVQQIADKYALPEMEFDPPERLMLFKIPLVDDRSSPEAILEHMQWAWQVRPERANRAQYMLAIYRGACIGVYELDQWLPATAENFPNHPLNWEKVWPPKYGFRAKIAPPDVWDRFVGERGKLVTNEAMIRGRPRMRYWKIT